MIIEHMYTLFYFLKNLLHVPVTMTYYVENLGKDRWQQKQDYNSRFEIWECYKPNIAKWFIRRDSFCIN